MDIFPQALIMNRNTYAAFMKGVVPSDNQVVPWDKSVLEIDNAEIDLVVARYFGKEENFSHPLKPFIVRTIYVTLLRFLLDEEKDKLLGLNEFLNRFNPLGEAGNEDDLLFDPELIPEDNDFLNSLTADEKICFEHVCHHIFFQMTSTNHFIETAMDNNTHKAEYYISRLFDPEHIGWDTYTVHYFLQEYTTQGFGRLVTLFSLWLEANEGDEAAKAALPFWREDITDPNEIKHVISDPDVKIYTLGDYATDLSMEKWAEKTKKEIKLNNDRPKLDKNGEAIISNKTREANRSLADMFDNHDNAIISGSFLKIPTNIIFGTISVFVNDDSLDKPWAEANGYDSLADMINGCLGRKHTRTLSNEDYKQIRALPIYQKVEESEEKDSVTTVLTNESPYTVLFCTARYDNSFVDDVEGAIIDPLALTVFSNFKGKPEYVNITACVIDPTDKNPVNDQIPAIRALKFVMNENKVKDIEDIYIDNVEAFLGNDPENYRAGINISLVEWGRISNLSYDDFNASLENEWSKEHTKKQNGDAFGVYSK